MSLCAVKGRDDHVFSAVRGISRRFILFGGYAMSRTLSSQALRACFAEETEDYPILLLTITHEELDEPIYISSDATQRISSTDEEILYGTVSRGTNFYFAPFQMQLPNISSDSAPRSRFSIDNVKRILVPIIRSFSTPPTISMELVWSFDVDTVDVEFPGFQIREVEYDDMAVSGEMNVDHLVDEPFPCGVFGPAEFPGVF
jgi:hypothetical protein